ncbi:MAG: alpha/beta hydrolase [Desulfobacterales bacterium]|jgi:3-oxoadipate enol-lactonase
MAVFDLADGLRMHYEVFGASANRPVIVFLNGTAQTTTNWRPLALRLQERCRVILYDARCQGRSGCGSGPLTLAQHAYDLVRLLDALALEQVGLVGLSHGARIALAATERMTTRIDGLMLLSLGLTSSARTALAFAAWRELLQSGGLAALFQAMMPMVFGERFLREHQAVIAKVAEALVQRNDEDKMLRLLAAIDDYPAVKASLPAQPVTTMVMTGADDLLVSEEEGRALAEQLGGGYQLLPDVGHSIPAESPDLLIDGIERFFKLAQGTSAS